MRDIDEELLNACWTVLMWASEKGHKEIVELLKYYGAKSEIIYL